MTSNQVKVINNLKTQACEWKVLTKARKWTRNRELKTSLVRLRRVSSNLKYSESKSSNLWPEQTWLVRCSLVIRIRLSMRLTNNLINLWRGDQLRVTIRIRIGRKTLGLALNFTLFLQIFHHPLSTMAHQWICQRSQLRTLFRTLKKGKNICRVW